MKIYFLFNFILLLALNCSKTKQAKILDLIYPDKKSYPKVLLCEDRKLSENHLLDTICIIRSKNEETFVVFHEEEKKLLIDTQLNFILHNYGDFEFDSNRNQWLAVKNNPENDGKPRILGTHFFKLPNDNYETIFIEVLSQEPPLNMFNTLLVYRNGTKIFDGFSLLDRLGEKYPTKIIWKYDAAKSELQIFYFDGKPLVSLVFTNDKFIER